MSRSNSSNWPSTSVVARPDRSAWFTGTRCRTVTTVRRVVQVVVICIVTGGLTVLAACAASEPNAIGTLPVLQTVPRSIAAEFQTTTTAAVEVPYTIQRYDTLFEIARAFGVDMDTLAAYNNIDRDEYDSIQAGQVLKVPNPLNPSGTFAPK